MPTFILLAIFCYVCALGEACATEQLTLRQALTQGLTTNPQLAAAGARVDDARGQRVQAGLKPNPRLTVQTEDLRTSQPGAPFSYADSTEDYLLIGQVLETAGKRDKRVAVAQSLERSQSLQLEMLRVQIASRITNAYWDALVAAQVRALAEETLRTYEEDVTYSQNRVHEGLMAEADLMRITVERDRSEAELLRLRRSEDETKVALFRAMGRMDFPDLLLSDSLQNPEPVPMPDILDALKKRPEMQLADEAIAEATDNLRLQRANARPDPEAIAGYKRNSGYDTAYLALQVDLPFRNRNQGNIGSAEARTRLADANRKAAEASVRADIASTSRAYLDQMAVLQRLPHTVTLARESERLTRAAFREGGIDLLRLLDAQRSRILVETEYYRALADAQQRALALRLASGTGVSELVGP